MAKTTELELAIKIAGKIDPSLQAAIRTAQKQVTGFSQGLSQTAKVAGALTMASTSAAAAIGVAATKTAMSRESAMADVAKVVDGLRDSTGKITQDYWDMWDGIKELITEVPMSFEEAAQIAAAAGQSGIQKDEILDFTKTAAEMAIAFDVSAEDAGKAMATWRQAFRMNQDEVVALADKVNYLSNKTNATAPQLTDYINRIGSLGELGGFGGGDGIASLAAIGDVMIASGTDTEKAATSARNMILAWTAGSAATKTQTEIMEKLGFDTQEFAKAMQTDAVGAMYDFFDAINMLPKDEQLSTMQAYFGKRSVEGVAKLAENIPAIEQALDYVGKSGEWSGSMLDEFNMRSSTTENSVTLATNAIKNLADSLGKAFLPYVKQAADFINTISAQIDEHAPEVQSKIAGVIDYVRNNGPKVAAILGSIAAAWGAMRFAPQIEMGVKAGAGLFGKATDAVSAAGGTAVKAGGGLLGGLGTLRSIVGTARTDAALNGTSTAGALARLAGQAVSNTKGVSGLRGYLGNVLGAATANNGSILTALGKTGVGQAVAAAHQTAQMNGGNTLDTLLQSVGINAQPMQWMQTTGQWAKQSVTQMPLVQVPLQAAKNVAGFAGNAASSVAGFAGNAVSAVANSPIAQAAGGLFSNAAGGLATAVSPFMSMFGGIATAALPVVAVIGSIVAAVSLLGDHLDDIRGIINNVFGEQGVAVFDGFLNTLTGIKDKIVGIFSPENLASVRTAIVGMFGEEAGTGFDNIVSIGQSVIGVFQQIVDFGTGTVKPMFEQVFGWVTSTLLPGLLNGFNTFAPLLGPLISSIGNAVMNLATLIGNAISAVLPIIENIIMLGISIATTVVPPIIAATTAIFTNISNIIGNLQGMLDGLIQFITGVFTGNWSQAWEGVKQIFGNAFDALIELCKIPINTVIGLINSAIRGINSIVGGGVTIPDWLGGGTFSLSLPEIPLLAKGGFTDGVSIAGEAGTEAVISFDPAYRKSNIANWQKAGQMLGVNSVPSGGVELKQVNAQNSSAGQGASFTFSPNITIQGNANRDDVQAALLDAKDVFERWFEEKMRKERRTAYAR